MIEQVTQWIRHNFFTKLELWNGILDARYYTESEIDTLLAGSGFSVLTLNTAGNWANYGGSYSVPAYEKIKNRVNLRGLVVRSSGTDTLIGTLPTGFRPSGYELFTVSGDDAYARIDVRTDGTMHLLAGTAAAYLSLAPISFSTL